MRFVVRPALDLVRRHLPHQRLVALHSLAVKPGEKQLALLHVRRLVEQQYRVLAQHWEQDPVALAGVEYPWVAGKHLLDVFGIGQHHPIALVQDPERERFAEARRALGEQPLGVTEPDRGLHRTRQPGARRKGGLSVHASTCLALGQVRDKSRTARHP